MSRPGPEEIAPVLLFVGIALYAISPSKAAETRPLPMWMMRSTEIREARRKAAMAFVIIVHAGVEIGLFFLVKAIFLRIQV